MSTIYAWIHDKTNVRRILRYNDYKNNYIYCNTCLWSGWMISLVLLLSFNYMRTACMSYGIWTVQIMLPLFLLTLENTMFQTTINISNECHVLDSDFQILNPARIRWNSATPLVFPNKIFVEKRKFRNLQTSRGSQELPHASVPSHCSTTSATLLVPGQVYLYSL